MIAEIAKKKTGRNSESHSTCREQGDLNSCLPIIGARGCKVTRAQLQELTHGGKAECGWRDTTKSLGQGTFEEPAQTLSHQAIPDKIKEH